MLDAFKLSILRGIVYALTLGLGALATWAAAAGFGSYSEASGLYTFSVSIPTVVTYLSGLIGGGGLALTALVKGWRK